MTNINIYTFTSNINMLAKMAIGVRGNAPISTLSIQGQHEVKLFFTELIKFTKTYGPITSDNAAYLILQLHHCRINQHLLGFLYSNLSIRVTSLNTLFHETGITFKTQASFINSTEAITIKSLIPYKQAFENVGVYSLIKIQLLPNIFINPYKSYQQKTMCIKNTDQENPDAVVTLYDNNGIMLDKYFTDVKLGSKHAFKSNIMLCHDPEELTIKMVDLIEKRLRFIRSLSKLFPDYPFLEDAFHILQNKKLSVLEKHMQVQDILIKNIYKLPANIKPTLLFDCTNSLQEGTFDIKVNKCALSDNSSTLKFVIETLKTQVPPRISHKLVNQSEGINPLVKHIFNGNPFLSKSFLEATSQML